MFVNVDAKRALIFRIVHLDNIDKILQHGLQCRNIVADADSYRNIGDLELIAKRRRRVVPIPPGGTLSDYVPFYFTYASPMLFNIRTGYRVPYCPNAEIVFLVTSLHKFNELGVQFLFTDRHAYLMAAQFSDDLNSLDRIDWGILQRRDFKQDPEDPGKMDRYMAEALAYREVPVNALLCLACYNVQIEARLKQTVAKRGIDLPTFVRDGWYF